MQLKTTCLSKRQKPDIQIPIQIKITPHASAEVQNFSFAMLCFNYGYGAYDRSNYVFKEVE